jgi:hypothetical protein
MLDALGDDTPVTGLEVNRPIAKLDQEMPTDNVEKFIFVVMLVPVILPLHHPQADHRLIDLAEGLIVPGNGAGLHQGGDVDVFQGAMEEVETGVVSEVLGLGHCLVLVGGCRNLEKGSEPGKGLVSGPSGLLRAAPHRTLWAVAPIGTETGLVLYARNDGRWKRPARGSRCVRNSIWWRRALPQPWTSPVHFNRSRWHW